MDKLEPLKKEYWLKKDLIKKRLEEFKKFYYSPVSWFFTDNIMTLKEVNTSDDERLFEELCFCILTANASAVMGMRCIDKLRGVLLKGTEKEIQEKLTGSHIYPNIRAKFIIHTREYLKNEFNFKLKEKLESFKDDESRRDFFATNKGIKGLGFKESSHYLRNIGFSGYSILDKHIINSLYEFGFLDKIDKPNNKKKYLLIEEKFKDLSNKTGIHMDELDLLLWSRKNGKILK